MTDKFYRNNFNLYAAYCELTHMKDYQLTIKICPSSEFDREWVESMEQHPDAAGVVIVQYQDGPSRTEFIRQDQVDEALTHHLRTIRMMSERVERPVGHLLYIGFYDTVNGLTTHINIDTYVEDE